MSDKQKPRVGRFRKMLRWMLVFLVLGTFAGGALTVFWLRGAIYNRYVRFPREAAAWVAIRADRKPVLETAGWNEYAGAIHSHSEFSHDSEVPFPEILRVLKETGREFIAMSDHCVEGRADFNMQWRGFHGGKLFIPGFEMKEGYMPFGLAPGSVLSNSMPGDVIARRTVEQGGVLFFAHSEEPRAWDCPQLSGMEIYNIHTDVKRRKGITWLLPDILVNLRVYPDHVMRRMFTRPSDLLARWDELNKTRPITGIAGNDCHQNNGVRVIYTKEGALRIEDTSPRTLRVVPLNAFTRRVAGLLLGPLEPGRKLLHLELDAYERMVRYVGTHILAHDLTEPDVLDALRAGRAFVGFDMIADSSGFRWLATNATARAVMGESIALAPGTQLRAHAPQHCRFTIVKDGASVHQAEGRDLEWAPSSPGRYRVEAELNVAGEYVPWVYANPITLR
jgi:hypothetical protein